MKTKYEVVVGNIGTVHTGNVKKEALRVYHQYVLTSRSNYGRSAGESVYLMADGEAIQEHQGKNDDEDRDEKAIKPRTGLRLSLRFEFPEDRLKEIEAEFKDNDVPAHKFLGYLRDVLGSDPKAIYDISLEDWTNPAGRGGL